MVDVLRDDGDDGQCMMARCTEADFLPTRCHDCNRRFCTHHISPHAHSCAVYSRGEAQAVKCPLCNQAIAVRPGESADRAVSSHIDLGCTPQAASRAAAQRLNMCSFGSCTRNEIQQIVCDGCGQTYCVEHRGPKQHQCVRPVRSPPPAPVSVGPSPTPQDSGTVTPPRKRKAKYVPMADLKPRNTPATALHLPPSSSHGPVQGQVMLRVFGYLPVRSDAPECIVPAFFSIATTSPIGRVLDSICSKLDVPNENHRASSDAERLWIHLLPKGNSAPVCLPPSLSVADCMAGAPLALGSANPKDSVDVMICKGTELPAVVLEDVTGARPQPAPTQQSSARDVPRTATPAAPQHQQQQQQPKPKSECVAA